MTKACMDDSYKGLIMIIVGSYLFISMWIVIIGILNAHSNACTGQYVRFEYIFPAHRLGCWLMKIPGSNND